jgi:hypothetical protein
MTREDDPKATDAPKGAPESRRAKGDGGNPDRPPSANAGNVGLGAADEDEAPRRPE